MLSISTKVNSRSDPPEQEVLYRNVHFNKQIDATAEAEINTSDSVQSAHELFGSLPDAPDMDEWNRVSDIHEDIEYSMTDK